LGAVGSGALAAGAAGGGLSAAPGFGMTVLKEVGSHVASGVTTTVSATTLTSLFLGGTLPTSEEIWTAIGVGAVMGKMGGLFHIGGHGASKGVQLFLGAQNVMIGAGGSLVLNHSPAAGAAGSVAHQTVKGPAGMAAAVATEVYLNLKFHH
jgi:hypothetical protein